MQFVCPYCGPIDWNNKYSYSYTNKQVLYIISLTHYFFFFHSCHSFLEGGRRVRDRMLIPLQSLHIITFVVSSNPAHGDVHSLLCTTRNSEREGT